MRKILHHSAHLLEWPDRLGSPQPTVHFTHPLVKGPESTVLGPKAFLCKASAQDWQKDIKHLGWAFRRNLTTSKESQTQTWGRFKNTTVFAPSKKLVALQSGLHDTTGLTWNLQIPKPQWSNKQRFNIRLWLKVALGLPTCRKFTKTLMFCIGNVSTNGSCSIVMSCVLER